MNVSRKSTSFIVSILMFCAHYASANGSILSCHTAEVFDAGYSIQLHQNPDDESQYHVFVSTVSGWGGEEVLFSGRSKLTAKKTYFGFGPCHIEVTPDHTQTPDVGTSFRFTVKENDVDELTDINGNTPWMTKQSCEKRQSLIEKLCK